MQQDKLPALQSVSPQLVERAERIRRRILKDLKALAEQITPELQQSKEIRGEYFRVVYQAIETAAKRLATITSAIWWIENQNESLTNLVSRNVPEETVKRINELCRAMRT